MGIVAVANELFSIAIQFEEPAAAGSQPQSSIHVFINRIDSGILARAVIE